MQAQPQLGMAYSQYVEIDEAGALLVRPDGVVAWRHRHGVAGGGAAELVLRQALVQLLDQERA